jgi:thioester reductase-like protein
VKLCVVFSIAERCLPFSLKAFFPLSGRFLGQINTSDFFTRLLCGIAYTGLAPQSFYKLPHGPGEHFDGMPIDFVAGVIAATTAAERSGFSNYHVVNPHWNDGISLDRIVDWVESAGYKVSLLGPAFAPLPCCMLEFFRRDLRRVSCMTAMAGAHSFPSLVNTLTVHFR